MPAPAPVDAPARELKSLRLFCSSPVCSDIERLSSTAVAADLTTGGAGGGGGGSGGFGGEKKLPILVLLRTMFCLVLLLIL